MGLFARAQYVQKLTLANLSDTLLDLDAMERESLASLRSECSAIILSGLSMFICCCFAVISFSCVMRHAELITKQQKVAMNYANYEKSVIERYKVKLVGWTYHQFVNPGEISTVEDARKLRDALKCGACRWVRLTRQEAADHSADIENRRAQGEEIGRARKQRSDKGVKRKRYDHDEPEASTSRKKKASTLSKVLPPRSRSVISTDDEHSSDDNNN